MSPFARIYSNRDTHAVIVLVLLWLLFFWRLFTPIAADQASLETGDFSGQFVAFAGYQYERLSRGEIPLWNPYNNGGLPFIADTQAAVFYPPRWGHDWAERLGRGLELQRLAVGNDLPCAVLFAAHVPIRAPGLPCETI